MAFNKKNPMDLVTRLLLLEQLKEFKPAQVKTVNEDMTSTFDSEDDEGNITEVVEIDWHYALFFSTIKELEHLATKFVRVEMPEKPTIIMP